MNRSIDGNRAKGRSSRRGRTSRGERAEGVRPSVFEKIGKMSKESELFVLKRRYTRLIRFDRGLWLIYALTSAVPLYALFRASAHPGFHIIGALAIAGVAWCGWKVNTNIINQTTQIEWPVYAVTVSFALSRLIVGAYGLYLFSAQYTQPGHFSSFLKGVIPGVFSLPFALLLLAVAIYRFLYHISIHFLLKIRSLEQTRSGTL